MMAYVRTKYIFTTKESTQSSDSDIQKFKVSQVHFRFYFLYVFALKQY